MSILIGVSVPGEVAYMYTLKLDEGLGRDQNKRCGRLYKCAKSLTQMSFFISWFHPDQKGSVHIRGCGGDLFVPA